MSLFKKYIGDLFVSTRFYLAAAACIVLFIISFFIPVLYPVAAVILVSLLLLIAADYILLFSGKPPSAQRFVNGRLSNGDSNTVSLRIRNNFRFAVNMKIIDELPFQFQERNFRIWKKIKDKTGITVSYLIKPVERGVYSFGDIIVYVHSGFGLVVRRCRIPSHEKVNVFPSFMQLRKYELVSHTVQVKEPGSKRMRKIGQSMEFEQVKDYVSGDDMRTINWKATARKGLLMVNNYVDEKSQQVYCIIDKGRLMKMPFNGLSLFDYAINSVLALSNVCLQKQDKIGLISFSNKMDTVLAADRKPVQRENILQSLYKEKTSFLESDFEMLYMQLRYKVKQRSLLILYTNFESLNGLRRQVNYLRSIARHHLLLVVFFENTELNKLSNADAYNIDDVYIKTIAEKFAFEKRLIVKELQKVGILSILTSPQNLTIHSINKYLELKARQAI